MRLFPVMAIVVTAAVLMTGSAVAQDRLSGDCSIPYEGAWTAPSGGLLEGRMSEAWCNEPYMPGEPGNSLLAESWDGSSLATQWKFWGMSIDAEGAVEVASDVNAMGFGWIDYVTNYEGGRFWLDGADPWSDGTDLTGDVVLCNVSARVTLVNFQPVALTSNITIVGVFDLCPVCSIEVAANSTRIWKTGDASAMPAGYPVFLCDANSGELHYSCCIDAEIMCTTTGAEESSWGAIKEMYR